MRTVAICLLLAFAALASAKPPFLKVFMAAYNIDPESAIGKARCLNCHENPGPPNRNAYGKLVQQALRATNSRMVTPDILKMVEAKDMGEGLTFLQKIERDLPPGQPIPEPAIAPLPLLLPARGPIPEDWRARYRSIAEMYRTRDLSSIKAIMSDDYVWLPAEGKAMNYRQSLDSMSDMFSSRRIAGDEKVRTFAQADGVVQIGFEIRFTITRQDGKTFRYREVGTDFWRNTDGKWKIFRTQDKLVQMSAPE